LACARPRKTGPGRPGIGASATARTTATVLFEVWAGVRTTNEAARLIGISAAGFYHLETRAVNAIIATCEPRERGPEPGAKAVQDVDRLQRENRRLGNDLARLQALVRSTQRLTGVAPSKAPATVITRTGQKRKARRPTVRALAHVRQLRRGEPAASSGGGGMNGAAATPSTSPPAPAIPATSPAGG
jgi:hypothetical protein